MISEILGFSFEISCSSPRLETEDTEDKSDSDDTCAYLRRVRMRSGVSLGSKVGESEKLLLLLEVDDEDAEQAAGVELSRFRKCPPWIGGTKLVQRPTIRPI